MSALIRPHELPLHLGLNVLIRSTDERDEWAALAPPTEPVGGTCDWGYCQEWAVTWRFSVHPDVITGWLPVCERHADKEARRIVPLYTECPNRHAMRGGWADCVRCDENGRVLVGRGSIEVVPVVEKPSDSPTKACLAPCARGMVLFWHDREPITEDTTPEQLHARSDLIGPLDPLPVAGRDFGIIIDCVEVAT